MNLCRLSTFRFALGFMVVLSGSASAWAQPSPDVYVLSVGIDRYQPPTNSLRGCIGDAVGMAKVFQSQAGKHYGKVETELLTDGKATGAAISKGLEALRTKGKAGDWYVIVLSGHAGLVRNQWGFLAHDNRNVFDTAVLGVADELAGAGKKVLVLIDACHAGQLRYAASAVLNRHTDSDKGGIILMISSMSDQLSNALGSYSAFARAVEEGLTGFADYDNDGAITLKELRRFTFNRVYELRLKNRSFPGLPVDAQDSAIDTSLSMGETTKLVQAKKPAIAPEADDGPEVATSLLRETMWKIAVPAGAGGPPLTYDLKLDPFGHFYAILKQGVRTVKIGAGAYKVHAKCVQLVHPQGTDRLEIVALTPDEFHFRFQGKEFKAKSQPPLHLLVDLTDRLSQEAPRDRVRKDSPHKVHPVTLEGGVTYLIDLMSPDFDTYLRLEDAKGAQIGENDDGGEGRNSRLVFVAPRSDVYRVIATTYRGGGGVYHLHVAKAATGIRPTERPSTGDVVLSLNHELKDTDPKDRVRTDSYSRAYPIALKAGVRYTIDMVSSDFDTYLRLDDRFGRPIAEDDDSGGNLNARLEFTPTKTDTYHIVATSYQPATGRFSLTVRAAANGRPVEPTAKDDVIFGRWRGAEDLQGYGDLQFEFLPRSISYMTDKDGKRQGDWTLDGKQVTLTFYNGTVVYRGTLAGNAMSGTATSGQKTWNWRVTREAVSPVPAGRIQSRRQIPAEPPFVSAIELLRW